MVVSAGGLRRSLTLAASVRDAVRKKSRSIATSATATFGQADLAWASFPVEDLSLAGGGANSAVIGWDILGESEVL